VEARLHRALQRIDIDQLHLSRAIELADRGLGRVSLNAGDGYTASLPSISSTDNQFEVSVDGLRDLARTLGAATPEERADLPGIDTRRADLLPAGAVVLSTALELFGATRAVHSEWGLREGVILDEIGAPAPASPGDVREAAVARLARRWGAAGEHPGTVRAHALELFDETEELHGLGDHERELLAYAARLHDIGVRISPDKSHRHGAYLVEHGGLRGFSPQEVAMMASMIRFHRGAGWPKPSYGPFAGLDQDERAACQVLTGILRIAHGLGRADESDVIEIGAKTRRGELRILVSGSANPEGAVAEAEERAGVLERAIGRRIRFEIVPEGTLVTRPA